MKRMLMLLLVGCLFMSWTNLKTYDNNVVNQIIQETKIKRKQNVENNLITEVDKYIKTVAPSSKVNADFLIKGCNDYNVDIIFVLAQGTLESHFATKGIGGKINSIFNVRVFDTVKSGNDVDKKYRYIHPDDSIEPYLQLLTENYLVDGKTEDDLLVNYVNKYGQRYATYPHYEKRLLSIMNGIKHNTKIDSLQQEYKNLDIIFL